MKKDINSTGSDDVCRQASLLRSLEDTNLHFEMVLNNQKCDYSPYRISSPLPRTLVNAGNAGTDENR